MLFLLKKIRYNILKENKYKSYLLYAIGEVFLVMIGIVMAVQVNEWDERNKDKERVLETLTHVQNELLLNIKEANYTIGYCDKKDSLIGRVMNNLVTEEDYQNNSSYRLLLLGYDNMIIRNKSYNKLLSQDEYILNQYESLLNKLNQSYQIKAHNDDMSDGISNFIDRYGEYLSNNYKWYAHTYPSYDVPKTITSEELDYYLDSGIYKNKVADYHGLFLMSMARKVRKYRHEAYLSFMAIKDRTQQPKILPKAIAELYKSYSLDTVNKYVGIYIGPGDMQYQILIKNDMLVIKEVGLKMDDSEEMKLYMSSVYNFTSTGEESFVFSEDGKSLNIQRFYIKDSNIILNKQE